MTARKNFWPQSLVCSGCSSSSTGGGRAKDIDARRWLSLPDLHVLSTDDASALARQVFSTCIGIAAVHVARGGAIARKVVDALAKRACRHEEVAHNVDRQAVEAGEDGKEGDVDDKFEEVCDQSVLTEVWLVW